MTKVVLFIYLMVRNKIPSNVYIVILKIRHFSVYGIFKNTHKYLTLVKFICEKYVNRLN